ncbi:MAG: response regulator transcription factor, partial [Pseudomonadota bacterium]
YACVLLDLGLPKRDGAALLQHVRELGDKTPVIVITARDGDASCVLSLDLGADDFLQKPFKLPVLLARMRAVVRRRSGSAQSQIGVPGLLLDLDTREAIVGDQRVVLTAREFTILAALLERPGAILSRAQIENRIYGWGDEVASNAVDVVIHGMRKKLGQDIIKNVRGLGWRAGES